MKILIVDDNQDITTMLMQYITFKGHSCSVANDSREGLHMIQTNQYDTVLLDLAMPEFSGIDIVDELYQSKKIQKLNVVALTASSISADQEECLKKKGVRAILRKPIDPDELLEYLLQSYAKSALR